MRDTKTVVILFILMLCIVIMLMTIFASATENIGGFARSFALYEPVTKTFILEKDSDVRLPMASTTKIMTGIIAIESCDLNEIIEIPSDAVGVEGSSLYLKEGDRLTVRDLVYSLLLQSANDAATALALKISGDIASFATLMNEKAIEIGLTDSHFDNPHGLDSKTHYTTAKDLAILSAYALENAVFREIASTYKYSFSISDKLRTVVNHNKLLKSYKGCTGVKTGYTDRSGRCLVSSAERNGLTLIAVTLDDPDDWRDHKSLLDFGFDAYESVDPFSLVKEEYNVPIINGTKDFAKCRLVTDDIKLVKRTNDDSLKAELDIPRYLTAPVKAGDAIGSVSFYLGERLIATAKIVSVDDITEVKHKFNIFDIF